MSGKRKGKLVSEHLEKVKGRAVEEYQDLIRDYIKGRNGLYALYNKNKLVYVGLAKNLLSRLKTHLKDRHRNKWDSFSVYLTKNDRHLREMEALVMRIAAPENNRQKGKFAGSRNLEKSFKRDIKNYFIQIGKNLFENGGKKIKGEKYKRLKKVSNRSNLAQYINKRTKLKIEHKGKKYSAVVNKNGIINFNGELFSSPSMAGAKALKRGCNGWYCWKIKNKKGGWVMLDSLRKKNAVYKK